MKFYYHPSPNPAKVALFLEESGLEYELVPVDTAKGEQHSASYRGQVLRQRCDGAFISVVDNELPFGRA